MTVFIIFDHMFQAKQIKSDGWLFFFFFFFNFLNMPHIILDDDDNTNYNDKGLPDILDHTHNYYCNAPSSTSSLESISSTQQGSTVAKTRQELMSEIEDTIEQLINSISLGESIKLPFTCRSNTITAKPQTLQM